MKNLLLTLALIFSFNANSQIAVMTAVDLKDGAEDDYLKLESFYSEIHKEAVKQGFRIWVVCMEKNSKEGDPDSSSQILFDNFTEYSI